MRKAEVVVGRQYIYDGCDLPGCIVTVVGEPRIQDPHGWVVNGTSPNTHGSVGAYRTRYLEPL